MNRRALAGVQIASAVVPILSRRLPRKKRILVWLVTTVAMALVARAMQSDEETAR